MKHRFAARIEMASEVIGDENLLEVRIISGSQIEFSLALAMLRHGVIEAIVVHDQDDARIQPIEIRVDPSHDSDTTTFVYQKRLTLFLTMQALDYWLVFFLRYSQDGVAEVDHLDLEAVSKSGFGPGLSVVVAVEDSLPPVPGEEARRLLGM